MLYFLWKQSEKLLRKIITFLSSYPFSEWIDWHYTVCFDTCGCFQCYELHLQCSEQGQNKVSVLGTVSNLTDIYLSTALWKTTFVHKRIEVFNCDRHKYIKTETRRSIYNSCKGATAVKVASEIKKLSQSFLCNKAVTAKVLIVYRRQCLKKGFPGRSE